MAKKNILEMSFEGKSVDLRIFHLIEFSKKSLKAVRKAEKRITKAIDSMNKLSQELVKYQGQLNSLLNRAVKKAIKKEAKKAA
jgi:hypothetical protein